MAPTRRRSLAISGHTPILDQRMQRREKVTVAGALGVWPLVRGWGRERLYCQLYPERTVNSLGYAEFIRALLGQIPGPVLLVHDRLQAHRGEWFEQLEGDFPRLQSAFLPPYAPELNPADALWAWVKGHALANFAPRNVPHLTRTLTCTLAALTAQRHLLRAFREAAELPW